MNAGIVDTIDLGWRLAAMIKGYGGSLLLTAYTIERRPMMIRALVRSHRHIFEHVKLAQISDSKLDLLDAPTPEGEALRHQIHAFLQESAPETRDRGIEFDLRYYHSPIVYQDRSDEPVWEVGRYTPSTRPGSRAPHVFLEDGETSVYDLFGTEFTLVQFGRVDGGTGNLQIEDSTTSSERAGDILTSTASSRGIPLKHVYIQDEPHARRIWERELVLVRPDTHIAWRGSCAEVLRLGQEGVHGIWDIVTGHVSSPLAEESPAAHAATERAFEEIVKGFLGEMHGREELGIQY
jgi:FAD-dependent monooxygenase